MALCPEPGSAAGFPSPPSSAAQVGLSSKRTLLVRTAARIYSIMYITLEPLYTVLCDKLSCQGAFLKGKCCFGFKLFHCDVLLKPISGKINTMKIYGAVLF